MAKETALEIPLAGPAPGCDRFVNNLAPSQDILESFEVPALDDAVQDRSGEIVPCLGGSEAGG
jgi:hypothetical protein